MEMIVGVEVTLEIEWIDLDKGKIGIICNIKPGSKKGGAASTARFALFIPDRILMQLQPRSHIQPQ